jgi:hypothetical protein
MPKKFWKDLVFGVPIGLLMWGLILLGISHAATYYLRADGTVTAANKANATGCGAANTAMNITQHNAATFAAGDTITLCDTGGVFRDAAALLPPTSGSGTGASIITYNASGTPIVSGASAITGWTQVGATNVYQAACDWTANSLYEDGVKRTKKAWNTNIATTDLAVNQWTLDTTGDLVYVWASDGADPDTHLMELSKLSYAMRNNNKVSLTFIGITFRNNNDGSDGVVSLGYNTIADVTFQNCIIEKGYGVGVYINGAVAPTNATISNNTIQNNARWGVHAAFPFTGTLIINGNTISGNGFDSVINNQQYDGIHGKIDGASIYDNIVHDNGTICRAVNECSGIYYSTASAAVVNIYRNTVYNHPNGGAIQVRGSSNIYQNKLYGNSGSGVDINTNGAINVAHVIYYNLIYGNGLIASAASKGIGVVKEAGQMSLTLYNNTIYQNTSAAGGSEVKIDQDLTALTMKNNIINTTATRYALSMVTQTAATIDNNLIYKANVKPVYYNADERTWATWQGYGFDTVGVNADPLFISTSDFHLQSTSPAINAGVDVGLTKDYEGNPVPAKHRAVRKPDIGAYEYQYRFTP